MKGLRTGGRVKSIGGSETVGAVGVGTVGNATGGVVLGRTTGATVDGRIGAYTVGAAVMGGVATGAITGPVLVKGIGAKTGAIVVCPSTRRTRATKENRRSMVLSSVEASKRIYFRFCGWKGRILSAPRVLCFGLVRV